MNQAELKRARALQNKKFRLEERRFLVQGRKVVEELLRSSWQTEVIFASEEATEFALPLAGPKKVPVRTLPLPRAGEDRHPREGQRARRAGAHAGAGEGARAAAERGDPRARRHRRPAQHGRPDAHRRLVRHRAGAVQPGLDGGVEPEVRPVDDGLALPRERPLRPPLRRADHAGGRVARICTSPTWAARRSTTCRWPRRRCW